MRDSRFCLLVFSFFVYRYRGKFGTVYKCREKSTNLCLAAKFIAVPNRKERKNVELEIQMMNRLQHPKIIQLYDAFEYNKMVCVVLELWVWFNSFAAFSDYSSGYRIDGGELFDRVLDDKFILTEKACSIFMRQICEAMDYIHEHNIIHLDLKVSKCQFRDKIESTFFSLSIYLN